MKSAVSIVKCRDYQEEAVLIGLRRSLDFIGGIGKFIEKGNGVLLKPNLLFGKAPEKAVTTHPAIVKGVIQLVREAGGIPSIGDSPSIGGLMWTAEKTGIKKVAEEMNCPLLEFNRPILHDKGEGRFFKKIEIDQSVLEADVVINLPKWKTHGMTLLTLGVKNLFGCIPGPRKPLWHLKVGEDRIAFAQMLLDLYRIIQPRLTILDGILAMEGNGPNSGHPVPLGLILASPDALNLDQIVCDILGIPRKSVPTNQVAIEQEFDKDDIEIVGETIKEVRVKGFKLPPSSGISWGLPKFFQNSLKNALTSKPHLSKEICKACNLCVEICPPKALERKDELLSIDDRKCIRCFCCQEVCPEGAITVKPGWASKFISKR
jgi:uncharacterized protein (DUF362 family)/Pyruvate/2-oxoacid:ferredoxin oxidoreductase delta subunit